jgi:hypothetical protein
MLGRLSRLRPNWPGFASLVASDQPRPVQLQLLGAAFIAILALTVAFIVYETGGTRYVYAHFAYVPILIGAFLFGLPGGALAGLGLGLLLGPYMPLDVAAGTSQEPTNWLVRAAFFFGIGTLAGTLTAALSRQLLKARRQGRFDSITNIPNTELLAETLQRMIRQQR